MSAKIFIHDEFDPESTAMLQALYSRSAESVEKHVEKVKETGSSNFMSSFYVGYGHASIGDCGFTTLFIEGLSIIATKAMQDNPLYSGQETSTRYIDFSKQAIIDPVNSKRSGKILQNWIDFYTQATEEVKEHLKKNFPLQPGEKEGVWQRAINARCFDILRGFLPAGVTTQMAWTTNLRQAHDKLSLLCHHPLKEVRDIAEDCLHNLKDKYPSSFNHKKYKDQENYLRESAFRSSYPLYNPNESPIHEFTYTSTIDNAELEKKDFIAIYDRPVKTNLPRHIGEYGTYTCEFELDYGSFRDLQRHRNGFCPIPLLDAKQGFHEWYLTRLPESLNLSATNLLLEQYREIEIMKEENNVSPEVLQYYYPLGAKVRCKVVYDLPQMVYVTELRSGSTVHPTLRHIAHKMHFALKTEHPSLNLYTDLSEDKWSIKRGHQDIYEKEEKE